MRLTYELLNIKCSTNVKLTPSLTWKIFFIKKNYKLLWNVQYKTKQKIFTYKIIYSSTFYAYTNSWTLKWSVNICWENILSPRTRISSFVQGNTSIYVSNKNSNAWIFTQDCICQHCSKMLTSRAVGWYLMAKLNATQNLFQSGCRERILTSFLSPVPNVHFIVLPLQERPTTC